MFFRLPDLRIAIVLDKKHPGTFQFQEVMDAGSTQFVKQMHDLQKTIFSDDPVNIQFTSVSEHFKQICYIYKNVPGGTLSINSASPNKPLQRLANCPWSS